MEQFETLKLVVESHDIPADLLTDANLLSMSQWLKDGGPGEKWREETGPCPKCGASSYFIVGEEGSFVVCPNCMNSQSEPSPVQSSSLASRPLADELLSRTPGRQVANAALQPTISTRPLCGMVCPTHTVPCALRRDHQKGHLHRNFEGTFCFFD